MDNWQELYKKQRALNGELLHILLSFREILNPEVRASLNQRKSDQIIKVVCQEIDTAYQKFSKG